MGVAEDMCKAGIPYGKLTPREPAGHNKHHQAMVLADCECGNSKVVLVHLLKKGTTSSCGCVRKAHGKKLGSTANLRHGHAKRGARTPEWRAWHGMVQRCTNPKNSRYADYGGRGIVVCEDWLSNFECFLADMGQRPAGPYSIERIDNEKGYEPGNCKWATSAEQHRNHRGNVNVTIDGETRCATDWLPILGISRDTYWWRRKQGMTTEEALAEGPATRKSAPIQHATLDGRTQTVATWCLELGLNYSSVRYRHAELGMTWEEALTKSLRPRSG